MNILVCNVGSTSLKYKLIEMAGERILASGKIERVGSDSSLFQHKAETGEGFKKEISVPDYYSAIKFMLDALKESQINLKNISAVGFKTVHAKGVSGTQLLTDEVLEAMEAYNFIAPAHNPPYINAIRMFKKMMPKTPLIGVFETSFHQTIPDYAYLYSVPYQWYEDYGIRRYGFHGASHRYVSERISELMSRKDLKVVTCHLGGSSSLCAVKNGQSVDTSMGFSPQAGIQNSNRCGDIDPFIPLYIMKQEGKSIEDVQQVLVNESGLLGLSGISRDIRDIEQAVKKGDKRAETALNAFCYEVKKYIGAYTAAMGGLDAVSFTGGIGENGVEVRKKICSGLECLGIKLDETKNRVRGKETLISTDDSRVKVFVIPTNEEIIVARESVKLLKSI